MTTTTQPLSTTFEAIMTRLKFDRADDDDNIDPNAELELQTTRTYDLSEIKALFRSGRRLKVTIEEVAE